MKGENLISQTTETSGEKNNYTNLSSEAKCLKQLLIWKEQKIHS